MITDRKRKTEKLVCCNCNLCSSSSFIMSFNMMLLLQTLFVLHSFVIPTIHCQANSPQNIETFYSVETPTQPPKPQALPPHQAPSPGPVVVASTGSTSNNKIVPAVAATATATAAGTLIVSVFIFLSIQKCFRERKKNVGVITTNTSALDRSVVHHVFERMEGNIKGLIVDEDGLDVVYWRKLQGKNSNEEENDDHEGGNQRKISEPIQEIPLLRGKSSTSHMNIFPQDSYTIMRITPPAPPPILNASVGKNVIKGVQKSDSNTQPFTLPLLPSLPKKHSNSFSSIPTITSHAPPPPPPPPILDRKSLVPQPPIPNRKSTAPSPPPPPPLPVSRKSSEPPSPPPKAGGFNLKLSSKPPPTPIDTPATTSKQGNSSRKVKLKPLHWDKVNTNLDHSMVWDKIDHGSFRVDGDLMEALFGYVVTKPNSKTRKGNDSTSPSRDATAIPTTAFILDPRKSQNTAIVLKSLAISRKEIIDALSDGQGLNADTIEKLSRIAPTEDEQSNILQYKGDSTRLAAAESFLYHILKAVPSAFKRLNAMLFRLNYDTEILEIKEVLQILEMGCKELRNQGIFVKLLEAVLKAGNRMNAGTNRGDAQAFNLASLRKLSDVKSVDGKTTLLHFVVEEVVRSEGKRAVINSHHSLSRNSSSSSRSSWNSNSNGESQNSSASSNEQKQRDYITLGLPIVGGVSAVYTNVKKAAVIDYNSFVGSISTLSARIVEIQQLVSQCESDKGGKFVREMNHFLKNVERELSIVREEQTRVMELLKRTTDYYQGGAKKDSAVEQPLYLFVIVKDFLGMVDLACIEIARNMQKRKIPKTNSG